MINYMLFKPNWLSCFKMQNTSFPRLGSVVMSIQESSNRSLGSWICKGQAETECQSTNNGALSTANPLCSFGVPACSTSTIPGLSMASMTATNRWPPNISCISSSLLCNSLFHRGNRGTVELKTFVCAISFTSITSCSCRGVQSFPGNSLQSREHEWPRTLETCSDSPSMPCPWSQTIVIVLSKYKTFWQKGRLLALFILSPGSFMATFWFLCMSDRFCLLAVEWKGTTFKYKLVLIVCRTRSCFLKPDYINVAIQASKVQKVSHPNYITSSEVPW